MTTVSSLAAHLSLADTLSHNRPVSTFTTLLLAHPSLNPILSPPPSSSDLPSSSSNSNSNSSSNANTTSCTYTILAPLNAALSSLPSPTWSLSPSLAPLPAPDDISPEQARSNQLSFLLRHVLRRAGNQPWEPGSKHGVMRVGSDGELGEGEQEVWWEERDGRRYVHPGGIEVEKVEGPGDNGEVWIINGVLKFPDSPA